LNLYVGKVAQTVIKVKIVGPIPATAMSLVRMLPTPAKDETMELE
jgi:hypothetical protein